jgi:hypothetical protein
MYNADKTMFDLPFNNIYVDEEGYHFPMGYTSREEADKELDCQRLLYDKGVYRIVVKPKKEVTK